jgi:hypothetical protein
MPSDEDFRELKGRIVGRLETGKQQVEQISDDEWRAYVKVRDILASYGGEDSASVGISGAGYVIHSSALKCAMMGIFEPTGGPRNVGEYDAGAVQRFADLGE